MSRRIPLSPNTFAALQQINAWAKDCRNFVIEERRVLALLVVVGSLYLVPMSVNEVGDIPWMSIAAGMVGVGIICLLGKFLPQQVSDALSYSVSLIGELFSILIWITLTSFEAQGRYLSRAGIKKLSKVGAEEGFLRPLRD